MNSTDDRAFLRRFSSIIFGFIVLTIAIIFLAFGLTSKFAPDATPSKGPLMEERVAPVAGVRTGEEDLVATTEAETEAPEVMVAADPVAAADASDAGPDGKAIYDSVCMACHMTGAAGAPIPGSDAMAERVAKGMDVIMNSAINGLNVMPPKGGRVDLSDDEVRAAVEYMVQ